MCRNSGRIASRRSWKRSCLGVGVYIQQLTVGSHFICGKDIVRIDVYIEQCVSLVFLFWGEVEKFRPSQSSRMSGSARQNLSPTWENYLGTAVRALRA